MMQSIYIAIRLAARVVQSNNLVVLGVSHAPGLGALPCGAPSIQLSRQANPAADLISNSFWIGSKDATRSKGISASICIIWGWWHWTRGPYTCRRPRAEQTKHGWTAISDVNCVCCQVFTSDY